MKLIETVTYGYWITPDNKLRTVGFQEHVKWFIGRFDVPTTALKPTVSDVYAEAFSTGYVKVTIGAGREGAEADFAGTQSRLQETLPLFLRLLHNQIDQVFVEIYTKDGVRWIDDAFDWPFSRGALIRFVKTGHHERHGRGTDV